MDVTWQSLQTINKILLQILAYFLHHTPMQEQSYQICSHMGKLTKKSLQSLLTNNYHSNCGSCARTFLTHHATYHLWVCLHCGQLFCSHQDKCLTEHYVMSEKNKQQHLFCMKMLINEFPIAGMEQKEKQQWEILCKNCGLVTGVNQGVAKDCEQLSKLTRFVSYIVSLAPRVVERIIERHQEQRKEQEEEQTSRHHVGLRNLGNTCFLNVSIQVLMRDSNMMELYGKEIGSEIFGFEKRRENRKFIEMFYDEVIEKHEENKWHVVVDKSKNKSKNETRRTGFTTSHFVKDPQFNIIWNSFAKIFQEEETINEGICLQPVQILHKLSDLDHKYQLKSEQDAEELMILVLDVLSQGEFILLTPNRDKKERYHKIQNLMGRQKLTPTQDVFGFYLASHVVCMGCFHESWVLDFSYHISLSLAPPQQIQIPDKIKQMTSLQQQPIKGIAYFTELFYPMESPQSHSNLPQLRNFFEPERLNYKQNYFKCEKCSNLIAFKQFHIVSPPKTLILSVKRFDPERKKSKVTKKVNIPQKINIENFTLRTDEFEELQKRNYFSYGLHAVVVHLGESVNSGHYVCYVKDESEGEMWNWYSDSSVRKVKASEVMSQEAYIVVYRRQQIESQ